MSEYCDSKLPATISFSFFFFKLNLNCSWGCILNLVLKTSKDSVHYLSRIFLSGHEIDPRHYHWWPAMRNELVTWTNLSCWLIYLRAPRMYWCFSDSIWWQESCGSMTSHLSASHSVWKNHKFCKSLAVVYWLRRTYVIILYLSIWPGEIWSDSATCQI